MKLLIAILSLAIPAAAQLTTMTGTLSDPTGGGGTNKLIATLTFKSGATFRAGAGWLVPAQLGRQVQATNGAWTAQFVPTDTARPDGQYYEVRIHFPLQTADGRNCEGNSTLVSQGLCVVGPADVGPYYMTVPTSATPVDVGAFTAFTRPPSGVRVAYGLIDFSGLGNGCFSILNSNATTFPCGALAAGLTWTHQTAYTWSQM